MKFLEAKELDKAKIVIIGVPFEVTSSYRKGSSLAPASIRRASQSIESYSFTFKADLRNLNFGDAGDLLLNDQIEKSLAQIAETVERNLKVGKKIVLLGGNHTVTIGAVSGAKRVFPDLQVAILDAHSDWRDSYEWCRYSHACTVRRIWEIVDGYVFVAGTRSFVGNEELNLYLSIDELPRKLEMSRPTYLSIDLDVLDPSLCPAVGNPEPGGLDYRQVIALFQAMRDFSVIGMDITELHPPYDFAEISAITTAKLLQEGMLAFWAKRDEKL